MRSGVKSRNVGFVEYCRVMSFCATSLLVGIKSKILPGSFKYLGDIHHFKPTAGCQMSTMVLGMGSINFSCKIPNGKVFAHLSFKSKVFPGSLTH